MLIVGAFLCLRYDNPDIWIFLEGIPMRLFLPCFMIFTSSAFAAESPHKWESAIAAFEESDRDKTPQPGAVLFVGSSSIRGWDLEKHFPDVPTINRGFGGSQMSDAVYYADRIVIPYKPSVIVVYAGDNDIAAGESAEQVTKDFEQFVQTVHEQLPTARIIFVAIKPSIKRWNLVNQMRLANKAIRSLIEKDPLLGFVDIDTPMIGTDGKPRKELFAKDGLHLNDEGYALWSELVGKKIAMMSVKTIKSD